MEQGDEGEKEGIPVIGGCIQDDLGTTTRLHMPGNSGMEGELSTANPRRGEHNVDKTRFNPTAQASKGSNQCTPVPLSSFTGRILMQKHSRQIGGMPMISSCGNLK